MQKIVHLKKIKNVGITYTLHLSEWVELVHCSRNNQYHSLTVTVIN